jgi:peroxiredoxin
MDCAKQDTRCGLRNIPKRPPPFGDGRSPYSHGAQSMSLAQDLSNFRTAFTGKVDPSIAAMMARADLDLSASDIASRALQAGDKAPDFELTDTIGGIVTLSDRLVNGPVVVSFYRGGWCPYCNLELKALQVALPRIESMGATLLAVSPQLPDESLSTAQKNALDFSVLSDLGGDVAKSYGVAFDLADDLRPIYDKFGHGLPKVNGAGWLLPIPATYVIDRDGTIVLAFVDTDYRTRLEPDAIIAALEALMMRIST